MASEGQAAVPHVIPPGEGTPFGFGEVRGRFVATGEHTGDRLTIAHMPHLPPRTLGAPLHRHHNEDEYTYVLEGTIGVIVDDQTFTLHPGTWLVKPRGLWHTFWNAGEEPGHVIEFISPPGFERYFQEAAPVAHDPQQLSAVNAKYALEMDFESIERLCQQFNLRFPQP